MLRSVNAYEFQPCLSLHVKYSTSRMFVVIPADSGPPVHCVSKTTLLWLAITNSGSRGSRLGQLPRASRKGHQRQEGRAKMTRIYITKNMWVTLNNQGHSLEILPRAPETIGPSLAITSTYINQFYQFLAGMLLREQAAKLLFIYPLHLSNASALPAGKTQKHENHIFLHKCCIRPIYCFSIVQPVAASFLQLLTCNSYSQCCRLPKSCNQLSSALACWSQ